MKNLETGIIYFTAQVNELIADSAAFTSFTLHSLRRHRSCDWGDVCTMDAEYNDQSLKNGGRILSSYTLPSSFASKSNKVWIITEADRSSTTVLFPSEY